MKNQLRWLALVMALIALISGSLGCATMLVSSAAKNHNDFYGKPVLSDEIVAIGCPDAALLKEVGQPHAVAFLGKKNTYMLYKGGEELDGVARLNLDKNRIDIDAARSQKLYLKGQQVWGGLILTYGGGNNVDDTERVELEKAGFTPVSGVKNNQYQKRIEIEGVISPAVQFSNKQMGELVRHREFNLYNPRDAKPPMNVGATLMLPVAVVADIVLVPVYLGVGVIMIVGSALHH
jgi:hypothetical protein